MSKRKATQKVAKNEQSKKSSKKSNQNKTFEKRSIDVKNDHVKAALTQYLWSLRMIDENETVTTWTPSDVKDCIQIHIRKEVID